MTGSAYDAQSKRLTSPLEPVIKRYATHCMPYSFTFADYIRRLNKQNDSFMCSFDVCSLFTNVSFEETINICAETLCDSPDSQLLFSKDVFVELMHSATSTVEFNFDNVIYKQMDRVASGSTFGPALANIFVEYHEEKFAQK